VVADIDVVLHLGAIHGGRGYVELHQAECARFAARDRVQVGGYLERMLTGRGAKDLQRSATSSPSTVSP
jgi:hypothetical protein